MRATSAAAVFIAAVLASCGTPPRLENAPPMVVEDCQREVAILKDEEIVPLPDDPLRRPAEETTPDPIEDARAAREAAGGVGVNEWPEDALLYRCLRSRGVELTEEQAEVLAEWDIEE